MYSPVIVFQWVWPEYTSLSVCASANVLPCYCLLVSVTRMYFHVCVFECKCTPLWLFLSEYDPNVLPCQCVRVRMYSLVIFLLVSVTRMYFPVSVFECECTPLWLFWIVCEWVWSDCTPLLMCVSECGPNVLPCQCVCVPMYSLVVVCEWMWPEYTRLWVCASANVLPRDCFSVSMTRMYFLFSVCECECTLFLLFISECDPNVLPCLYVWVRMYSPVIVFEWVWPKCTPPSMCLSANVHLVIFC